MVSIVTVYRENADIFQEYWLPLIFKHGPVEFIVVDNASIYSKLSAPTLPNLKTITSPEEVERNKARKLGVSKAKSDIIFLCTMKAVPTYETMVLLESVKENQMLFPSWINLDRNIKIPTTNKNSFSVERNKYLACDENKYISTYEPEVLYKGTLYYV